MRKKLLLFLSLFFAASVSAQMSGTYTISGDASQNPDYQTINAAATAVASQGVNGDVTFEIAPGTYSEYVTLNSIAGVSDDARVTFKGMGADNTGVVITSNAGYTSNSTLKLDGPDFVTFENMTIQSTSENNAIVVDLCGGLEGDVFKNVRFIGCVWESSSTDNNKNVVYRASGSWLDVNNSFIDCDFVNGCVGLYYQGYNTTQYNDGLVVENCTFTNQSMKGVYVTFTDHVTVNGCTINNLTNDLKSDYNAIDVANCRYNCVFENNVMNVTRNNTYATVFKIRSGIGTEEAPVIVRNNIINLETSVSSNSYALSIDQNATDWVYILHNTFNIKGSGVGSNFFLQKNITNVFVYNNLFVNETSGYVLRFANNITGRECDYNRVSFAGENVGLQAGTDYATLADWNTATGYDANTTTCTPNFVSATNLHLADTTGSVLVPHVCALAPTDIDGENRSATTPCAGADELGATIPMGDTYSITIADTENGEVEASADEAEEGTVIVLTVTPDAGYELFSLTYVYGDNDPIDITTAKSFTMPAADVTVNATFKHAPVETLIAHFEDLEIDSDGFWKPTEDEQDDMGYAYMQSQGWAFQNYYYDYYGWTGTMGFTASNCSDTTLTGLDAQYTAVTGKGHKSTNYAMCYPMGNTTVAAVDGYPRTVTGCYITNDLWTYQAILEGDGYGPAFGGNDGTEPDYLKIIATGLDEEGEEIGTTEFYLADYRFENSEEDYVVTDWRWFDLSVLGEVSAIRFDLVGSRNNDYGLTTPGYFCMDDYNGEAPAEPVETLIAHFEDVELNADGIWQAETFDENTYFYSQGWKFTAFTSEYYWSSFTVSNSTNTELTGYAGQYTATTGKGVNGSDNYAVAYVYNTEVSAIDGYPRTVTGCYVTNDMYTYTSLMEGDYYSGGPFETGDYLVLYAIGLDEEGEEISNAEFYLADYRSANEAEHYIVTDWKWFDLSVLGEVSKVRFEMDGSRTGDWGLNTPAYFCMDDFNGVEPVEPVCEAVQPLNLAATLEGNDVTLIWDYTPAGATVYDFEGATEEEGQQGWTTIDADGDGYKWYWLGYGVNQTTGVMCHEGIGGWTSASYQGAALNPDNYLVSPQVTVTGSNNTFKFWANAQDASWAAEHFGVAISTTGNTSAADFTTIQEWDMTAKASGTWYEFTIDLSDYMGQAIYVAIRHFNCSDMFRINVDDVTFTGAGGDGTTFNVYRSTDGENYELIDTVEELSYTDEDLDYGTYYYQVTSVSTLSDGTECESDPALAANGQDDFVMVELIEPTYECVTPINLDATANGGSAILTWEMPGGASYEYDFEGGLSGWTTFEGAGAESTWVHSDNNAGGYDYTEHAHSGTGFAVSYSFVDYVGEYQADNYLVSPVKYSIANGTTMTFFYDFANESYADFFAVEISTGSNNTAADFTEVWSSDAKKVNGGNAIVRKVNGTRYDNWQEATVDLSAYAGQEVWIAFHHEDYDMYEIWIDDVTVGAGASAPLFNIYRSTDGVTYELIAEGVEEMSYTDNGLGDGTYYYQVTSVQYGLDGEVACESDPALAVNGQDDFVMVVIDGIGENETAINVYPNPSNGVVNVKVDGYEMFTYIVYNSIGQIVMTGTTADAVTTIDLSTYGSGMYLLNVNLNGDVTTKKIFIK